MCLAQGPQRNDAGEARNLDPSVFHYKKIINTNTFSVQFIKIMFHYKKIGYNIIH